MTTATTRQARYLWKSPCGDKSRYLLIDRVSAHEVASVTYLSSKRKWHWIRTTTRLLHGAEPAQGIARLLTEAKESVERGLPQEM